MIHLVIEPYELCVKYPCKMQCLPSIGRFDSTEFVPNVYGSVSFCVSFVRVSIGYCAFSGDCVNFEPFSIQTFDFVLEIDAI